MQSTFRTEIHVHSSEHLQYKTTLQATKLFYNSDTAPLTIQCTHPTLRILTFSSGRAFVICMYKLYIQFIYNTAAGLHQVEAWFSVSIATGGFDDRYCRGEDTGQSCIRHLSLVSFHETAFVVLITSCICVSLREVAVAKSFPAVGWPAGNGHTWYHGRWALVGLLAVSGWMAVCWTGGLRLTPNPDSARASSPATFISSQDV